MSDDIAEILDKAFDSLRQGKVGDAISLSEGILSRDPEHAGALHLSGVAALMAGRSLEGRTRLEEAALRAPNTAEIWRNLGTARLKEGDEVGALEALHRAMDIQPGYQGAALALGGLLTRRGAMAEAAAVYTPFRNSAEAMRALASVLNAMGAYGDALEIIAQSLTLEGEATPVTLVNRGHAILGLGRAGEAAELFRHAMALDGTYWPARLGLCTALARSGNWRAAARAFGANVTDFPALALLADSLAPSVPTGVEEIETARNQLRHRLADLREKAAFIPDPNALVGGVAHPEFALYEGDSHHLATEVADTLRAICPVLCTVSEQAWDPRPAKDGRRRVGILFHRFSGAGPGGLQAGLVEALLGRSDLEVTLIVPGHPHGPLWDRMSTRAETVLVLPRDVLRAHLLLAEARLEVLLYPELGTDDFTMILAHGRYAPVQCVLLGHPLTTGLPSIDYALVGELLEGPGAQAHYREELVRLPGFLAHVPRPVSADADRAKLNLPSRETLYLCGQRLSKIHPDMDALFARILREDPRGLLCLFRDAEPALTERMMERLKGAGLPEDRVLWLKRTRRDIYLAALGAADVVLDTLYWGGGLTAFEALGMGKPLVTLQGNTLRSRRAAGLSRMIGVSDAVARTEDGYVRIATSLGRDATKRAVLSTRIHAAAAVLFEDTASVEALASFLVSAKPKANTQVR
ncbi:hypothetical protein [Rhodospirillum sp. A1_3_36]|uniref:O-linked N-acetylglucosamine transferase family protein n=1 Tax=Rhodospirillum sp. A1_3_36 TaxID=3391666 RepID=UPI0039A4C530